MPTKTKRPKDAPPLKKAIDAALKGKTADNSLHGVSCYFVPVTPFWGVKVYGSFYDRDEARDTQKEAAKYDLAPRVGKSYDLPEGPCYVTEIAEVVAPFNSEFEPDCQTDSSLDDWEELESEYRYEMNELIDELEDKIDWTFRDDHLGNVGYLNGRMVCIDFG
jgi:hypothetical protein